MTVETSIDKVTANGNDLATNFSFNPLVIFASSDIEVYLLGTNGVETLLTENTHYTVNVTNYPGTGSITYPVAGDPLATGESLTIVRNLPLEQTVDLENQGGYFPNTLETALDKLAMISIQQQEQINRTLKLRVSSTENPTDTDVDNVATVAGIASDVTTVAGNSANVTSVAGNAANITTVAGDTAAINLLAPISSQISIVSGNTVDINTVATSIANVETVATDITKVNTVSDSIASVNTVAPISSDVTAVAAVASDIPGLADTVIAAQSTLRGINAVTDLNYTLVADDAGKVVELNRTVGGTQNVIVPPQSSVNFPVGTVIEIVGRGTTTNSIVEGSGVFVRSADSALTLRTRYSGATLYKRGTDEWVLVGDLI